jgi:hypothetical protein
MTKDLIQIGFVLVGAWAMKEQTLGDHGIALQLFMLLTMLATFAFL